MRFLRPALAGVLASLVLAAPAAPAVAAVGGYEPVHGQVWQQRIKAPDFVVSTVDDGRASLAQYAGKVRIIDFWATWCPPCRREIPGFISLQRKYGAKGLVVLGLSIDDNPATVAQYAQQVGINYPMLMADAATRRAYGNVRSIPTTFVVGRRGYIYKSYLGAIDESRFEADVKALL